jgi:hypothetical protein
MGFMNWFKKNDNILQISLGPLGGCPMFHLDKSSGQLTITTGPMKNVTLSVSSLTQLQLEQKGLLSCELHIFINNIKTYSLDSPLVDYQKLQDCLIRMKEFQNEKLKS